MSLRLQDPEIQELLGNGSEARPSRATPEVAGEVLPPAISALAGGAYEGASRFDRELALWSPSTGSADSDILPSKPILDARVKDMARNDAFVKSGINIHKDSIVGAQFTLNSKPEYELLGLDETWAEEFQTEVEAKFTAYAESLANWSDAAGKNGLTAQVRLAIGTELMVGEVLAISEWVEEPNRPYSTAFQMIDPDRLSDPSTINPFGDRLRGGILHNTRGQAMGYFIRSKHPGNYQSWGIDGHQHKFIPARKRWGRQQVIHIFDQTRPEQSRGVSVMVAALKEMKMTKGFREVVLQNAVVNATFAASIESELPAEAVFAQMGAGGDSMTEAIMNYGGSFLAAVDKYSGNSRNAHLNGVRIPHFYPGTKLQLRPAGQGGPLGNDFEQSLLRYIAADLDLTYEQLSRDYSQSNYSSLKGAINETEKSMRARKRMTADRYASTLFMNWLEEALAKGDITAMPSRAPNFWDGMNREAYAACTWIGGAGGQIDELKETQAATLRLKYQLSTHEDELARMGKDWRKVYRQLAREKKMRKDLGIELEADLITDNMMNAATGVVREKEAKPEKSIGTEKTSAIGTLENDFFDAQDSENIDERPNS